MQRKLHRENDFWVKKQRRWENKGKGHGKQEETASRKEEPDRKVNMLRKGKEAGVAKVTVGLRDTGRVGGCVKCFEVGEVL